MALQNTIFVSKITSETSSVGGLGHIGGAVHPDVHLDLSGLSDSESVMLTQSNPDVVNRVMVELQVLVDQINAKRPIE